MIPQILVANESYRKNFCIKNNIIQRPRWEQTKNKVSNLANNVDWKRTGLNFSRYGDSIIMGFHPLCRGFLDDSLTPKEKTGYKILGAALIASQLAPAVIGRVGTQIAKGVKAQNTVKEMVKNAKKVKIKADKGYTYYKGFEKVNNFFVFKDPEAKDGPFA